MKFNGITTGVFCSGNYFFCNINIAIMIYSNFTNYKNRMTITNKTIANFNFSFAHYSFQKVFKNYS